jgi:hypothetical protein
VDYAELLNKDLVAEMAAKARAKNTEQRTAQPKTL